MERLKYFEKMNEQKAYSSYYSNKNSHRTHNGEIPKLDLNGENDVFQHEANLIKEERVAMLLRLKKDVQTLADSQLN